MQKVTIISLGWLGLALYHKLSDQKFEVSGSYLNTQKKVLHEYQFDINSDKSNRYISDSEVVIIAIPPSKIINEENFINFLVSLSSKKLIFISSTSVYGNQGEVDELTIPTPESTNGKRLLEWENLIKTTFRNYQIIRSAGQYGGLRHPGKFLSGRVDIRGAQDPINLISQNDLIDIIIRTIESSESRIINAVNTNHPTKKEYYTSYCKRSDLPLPIFTDNAKAGIKIVNSVHPEYLIKSDLS